MTSITFYSHALDRFQIAIRVAAKAVKRKMKVSILTCTDMESNQLSDALWAASDTSFLPNCRSDDQNVALTPIAIDYDAKALRKEGLLINLTNDIPPFFSTFERLIEIVCQEPIVNIPARKRYLHYRDRGYPIQSFSLKK